MDIEKIYTEYPAKTVEEISAMEDWLGYLLKHKVEGLLPSDLQEGIDGLSRYFSWEEEYLICVRKFPSNNREFIPVKSFNELQGLPVRGYVKLDCLETLFQGIESGHLEGHLISESELTRCNLNQEFILVCGREVKVRNMVRNILPFCK
jgi:hypothetical protein